MRESTSRIKVGIVGSGGMAGRRASNFAAHDAFSVSMVGSRNRETGIALASEVNASFVQDWHELVKSDRVEAVVICTHNDSHGEIAVEALRNGKHVFCEYPLARYVEQARSAVELADRENLVLRLTHRENISGVHQRLRELVGQHGPLLAGTFTRLTPGRGARPGILFNLPVSGPPALFFIYHVYPMVDLFGPAEWVEASAEYEELQQDGRYQRFVNTVTVRFRRGGLGHWFWAGGIEIERAEQSCRYVLSGCTLIQRPAGWQISRTDSTEDVQPVEHMPPSLEDLFCKDIQGDPTNWRLHAEIALQAVEVSLAAERSTEENRRIYL